MRRRFTTEARTQMPEELRRRPYTREETDRWLRPGEQMPKDWDLGGEAWWRLLTAHRRWSDARRAWLTENDPTYWWHRDRVAQRARAGRS